MSELDLSAFADSTFEQVVNVSSQTLKFTISESPGKLRQISLAPGNRTLIERGYLQRRRSAAGDIIPSVIDMKTGRRDKNGKFDATQPEKLVPVASEQGQAYLASAGVEVKVADTPAKPAAELAAKPKAKPKAKKSKAKAKAPSSTPAEAQDPFMVGEA